MIRLQEDFNQLRKVVETHHPNLYLSDDEFDDPEHPALLSRGDLTNSETQLFEDLRSAAGTE